MNVNNENALAFYLKDITQTLINENKLDIELWTKLLNKMYDANDVEITSSVFASLEILFLFGNYTEYLKENLNVELRDQYEYLEKYYN